MEEILSKSNVNVVKDTDLIDSIVPKEKKIEHLEDGYYRRKFSKINKMIVKRIYGNPLK